MASAVEVKNAYEDWLLSIPGVAGVAADRARNELVVMVEDSMVCHRIPRVLDGVRVRCEYIGRILRYSPPEAKALKEAVSKALLEVTGVSGIAAIDPPEEPGVREVVLFVEREEDAEAMPRILAGVPVKVEVIGKVMALSQAVALSRYSKVRPIVGGISISNTIFGGAGTLSFVTDDGFGLTNAHVAAICDISPGPLCGSIKWCRLGTSIVQPAIADMGGDVIGYLDGYSRIYTCSTAIANTVDVAWFRVEGDYKPYTILGDYGEYTIDPSPVDDEVEPGAELRKTGRTTGTTYAKVKYTDARIKVWYTEEGPWSIFDDVILTDVFSQPGDSGSPVDFNGGWAGMVFAGSDKVTIVEKASNIIRALRGASTTVTTSRFGVMIAGVASILLSRVIK